MAALFLVAVLHKTLTLAGGRAASEPILASTSWRRSHARSVLVAATLAELVVAFLLIATSVAGLIGSALLILAYLREVLRLPTTARCNCFGAVAPASRVAAIYRDVVFIFLATAGAFIAATSRTADPWDPAVIAALLPFVALLAASQVLTYSAHSIPPEPSP